MHWLYLLFLPVLILPIMPAYAQTISVNGTTPCFLNYTAGYQILQNCGLDRDYIQFALLPWEWITGGNFSLVLVSVLIFITYQKYQKIVYPILIGVMFLPLAYFVFPDVFLSWAIIMAFVGIGILVWYAYVRQTKEYD